MIFDCTKQNDIVFVPETLISDLSEIACLSAGWSGPSFCFPAIGRQGGVSVLISENFNGKVLNWREDSAVRVLTLLIEIGSCRINFLNVYAPTNLTERKIFFDNLHSVALLYL